MQHNMIAVDPDVTAFLSRPHGLFIDGEQQASEAEDRLQVFNPATGKTIASVPNATPGDVDKAVRSAHAAFVDGRWRKLRPADRERLLLRFADLVERESEALAQLETLEQGKSIAIARAVALGSGIDYMRYAAGLATKLTGMTLDLSIPAPPGVNFTAYTRREPVGVVAGIAPWNFPLTIALWKVMPALAAGCSIVLKPSEITPLGALRLAELAIEAGIPPGVFNVVTGDGQQSGEALVTSPLIAKISFTGSTATGRQIARLASERMVRTSLELGGKNPALVLKDADVDATVAGLMVGAFFNQGQICAAVSRIYAEASIFDAVVAGLSDAVKALAVGPGLDPSAQINPLVSATHREKVTTYISDAADREIELIQGAEGPDPSGYYVRPTLVVSPDAGARLVREEVFGPVLAVTRVADAEEGIVAANDTDMGLTASLWTRDLKSTMDIVPRLEAGTVWVNSHVPIDANLPFGGYKQSGVGRDFGPNWLHAFTEEKSVCIAH